MPIIVLNYVTDPLWLFDHSNQYNDIQQGFNERQQKVNHLTFQMKSMMPCCWEAAVRPILININLRT